MPQASTRRFQRNRRILLAFLPLFLGLLADAPVSTLSAPGWLLLSFNY